MENTRKDRLVRGTILIGGMLFLLAMAYGSGMRARTSEIRAIHEVRKRALQDYRDAQRKLRFRLVVARQLEARRQVALALNELDKRNFGVTGDHLKAAVAQLEAIDTANAAVPDLSTVVANIKQVNTGAFQDYEGLRKELLAIADALDATLNNFVPTFIDESAADDTAHPIEKPTMNDVPLPPGNDVTRTH